MSILDDFFESLVASGTKAFARGADSMLDDAEKKVQRTRVKVQKTIKTLDDNMNVVDATIEETETDHGQKA